MGKVTTLMPTASAVDRLMAAIEEVKATHGYGRPAVRAALELTGLMVRHPTLSGRDVSFAAAVGERSATVLEHAARGQPTMLSRQLRMAAATASLESPVSRRRDGDLYKLVATAPAHRHRR